MSCYNGLSTEIKTMKQGKPSLFAVLSIPTLISLEFAVAIDVQTLKEIYLGVGSVLVRVQNNASTFFESSHLP